MNTRRQTVRRSNRGHRAYSTGAGFRAWIKSTLSQSLTVDARRLACERLECRYAMHAMPWGSEPFGYNEFHVEGEFAPLDAQVATHSAGSSSDTSSSTESDSNCEELDSAGDSSARPVRHLIAEGEFTPDRGGRGGPRESLGSTTWFFVNESQANSGSQGNAVGSDLVKLPPRQPGDFGSGGGANSVANNSVANNSGANTSGGKATETLTQQNNLGANNSPTGNLTKVIDVPSSSVNLNLNIAQPPRVDLGQFTSSARGGLSTNFNSNAANFNSGAPASQSNSGLRVSNNATDLSSSTQNRLASLTTSTQASVASTYSTARSLDSSNVSSSISSTTQSVVASSLLNDRAQRSLVGQEQQQSTAWEAEQAGLLDELRSVVDRLAGQRDVDRATNSTGKSLGVSERGLDGSLAQDASGREQRAGQDESGLLELATPTERLAASAPLDAYAAQADVAAQHRGLALASMGLHREFDLDGQSVGSLEGLVDPARLLTETPQLAAESVDAWHEQLVTADETVNATLDADNSVFTQSLLPLSFLAVGGLLIESRRRYKRVSLQSK